MPDRTNGKVNLFKRAFHYVSVVISALAVLSSSIYYNSSAKMIWLLTITFYPWC